MRCRKVCVFRGCIADAISLSRQEEQDSVSVCVGAGVWSTDSFSITVGGKVSMWTQMQGGLWISKMSKFSKLSVERKRAEEV